MQKIEEWIKVVDKSLEDASRNKSGINPGILSLPGMSGTKTRHFLNNVVSDIGGRYLEIGVWKGSTFCSALNGSKTNNFCIAVDDWSEFSGPSADFHSNISNYIDLENVKVRFVESDYRKLTGKDLLVDRFGKFPIYLYDGPHKFQDHYDAVSMFLDHLEDDFVYLCDDWNWVNDVEAGTRKAFEDLGIVVHKEWVMKTPNNTDSDIRGWWNGYYAAVCSKP